MKQTGKFATRVGHVVSIPERDVWIFAGEMIANYSDLAAIEASKQADMYLQAGDLDGQAVCLRVVKAITSMTDTHDQTKN